MASCTANARGQVTIPKPLREKLGIRAGTTVTFEERDGRLVLEAHPDIDPDQAWFWTPEFQANLKEALEDSEAGRVSPWFDDPEELIAYLKRGGQGD